MRLSPTPPILLSVLAFVLSGTWPVEAAPFLFHTEVHSLQERDGGNCGADLQYTCTAGESCSTTADANGYNIAFCAAAATPVGGDGSYSFAVYTETFTETDLVVQTRTYTSSWQVAQTTPFAGEGTPQPAQAICTASLGQQSCGAICCASDQACAGSGSCTATTTFYTSVGPAPTATTSSYISPERPTGSGTTTAPATITQPFIPPATASGSTLPIVNHSAPSNGLSGGEIAGIVIGVLAGVSILILICFCCIVRAGLHGLLVLLGLRKEKQPERTGGRNSRHSGSGTASRRDTHRTWFGASRPSRPQQPKKKSSGPGGWAAFAAAAVGLAVILGLRRKHNKKEQEKRRPVEVASTYYYSDSYTGTSASK